MRVPLEWLREYVDIVLSPQELADRLTLSGTKVEGIITIGEGWDDIYIGKIIRLEPHPNASRLQLCTVSLGSRGEQTVATGAFNIAVGDNVPYIGVGGRLPDGTVLEARPMRGFVSAGMVLAEDELALGDDHEGIYILGSDAPVGRPLRDYLGDVVLDLEITPNRPDCLSMIGVAREVAALTGQILRLPDSHVSDDLMTDPPISQLASVRIADPDLCPRYTAAAVSDITVKPAPFWMARRLRAAGIRSISNIVDISNYVMLEWGQPLHAFDLARVADRQIIVRRAHPGETITTLDGQTRTLAPEMLLITDPQGPIGVGGVMGAANSEISDTTTTVLIEAANFAPRNIRRTSQGLGLRSEASGRFEKGLPWSLPPQALARAAQLVAQLGGGKIHRGIIDATVPAPGERWITLPEGDVTRLLGVSFTRQQVIDSLVPLGFTCVDHPTDPTLLNMRVPDWRNDVQESADLVEEVARQLGFDQIPATLMHNVIPIAPDPAEQVWDVRLRRFLLECGLSECFSYTLIGDASLRPLLGLAVGDPVTPDAVASLAVNPAAVTARGATFELLRLVNPLTPDKEVLRPTLLPSLVSILQTNLRHTEEELAFFELGRCYFPRPESDALPYERRTLGIALAGLRQPRSWHEAPRPVDFYDLKGIVEELLGFCGLIPADPTVTEHLTPAYTLARRAHPFLHPGRSASVTLADGRELAFFGEIHPALAGDLDLGTDRCYVLELDADLLVEVATTARQFSPIPRFPPVKRDLAVIVPDTVPAQAVVQTIRRAGAPLLADVRLFDLYRGEQVPAGHKSLACALTYQSTDRTLAEREIDELESRIGSALAAAVGGQDRDPGSGR